MAAHLSPPSAYHQCVDIQRLSPIDAGQVITLSLAIVNQQFKNFQIVFIGQPHGELEQSGHQLMIAPEEPLDLAIKYPDQSLECFDFVNVVLWVGYDVNKGRLTNGFKTTEFLAQEIIEKLEQHLEAKKNPKILISSAGSKYNVENLSQNTVSIDEQGYLRVNDIRLWVQKSGPLKAASFRSDKIIGIEEIEGRIIFPDPQDPSPMFYIDLKQFFQPSPDEIPEDKRIDAEGYFGKYFLFLREEVKV